MNTKVVSTPVRKRTQKDGTTRIIRLAGQKSAPMMAFFYVLDGKVHACGSDHLCRLMCQAVSLNDIIPQVGTEEKTKAPKQIDLRKLDMNIDWSHVPINTLRHTYSQLNFTKGQRERTTYSESNRPSYWPEGIPFCSHSRRQDNGAGRVMTSSMMTSVLHSFKKHCLKKIFAGFIPINIASSNSMDELRALSRELSLSLLGDHDYAKPNPEQEVIHPDGNIKSDTEICCHLYDSFQNKDHQMAIDALREMKYCTHHLEQVLSDVPDGMFHMQFMPDCTKTNRRFPTLPDDLIACGPGLPLWEIFYHFPNIVAVRCYAHAIIHLDHYVKQFHYLGQTAESLAERFCSVPKDDASLEDVLLEQAKAVLYIPSNPGPGVLLFLAGMLGREVHLHKEDIVISSCPCPCACQHNEEVHVYMDKADRVYFLHKEEIIQDELPTKRKRQKREISSDLTLRRLVLPAREETGDKRIFIYKKMEIWKSDLHRVVTGQWLDDHIMDCVLVMLKDQTGRSDISIQLSSFGTQIQSPKMDIKKLQRELRGGYEECKFALLPVCNNVHWYLVAVDYVGHEIFILCSLNGMYDTVARNLQRIFQTKDKIDDFKVLYPKVQKQTNGRDCGVFVIMFAKALMLQVKKTFDVSWEKLVDANDVENNGRNAIHDLIMSQLDEK